MVLACGLVGKMSLSQLGHDLCQAWQIIANPTTTDMLTKLWINKGNKKMESGIILIKSPRS